MKYGDLPASEIASKLDYAKVTETVSKAIKLLMDEGKVVYSEPEKKNSKNQRICLVEPDNEQ